MRFTHSFAASILVMGLSTPAIAGSHETASAVEMCASEEHVSQVNDFYAEKPGTMPTIASMRLGLPESIIVSALPPEQSVSAPGSDFAEIWAKMGDWETATFLIMKGKNVFEISSAIGKGKKSETSDYFNIEYVHPMRGHLRPDLYSSAYAVKLPVDDENMARGILFYDQEGNSVFGAFMSGDSEMPPASEIAKFDALFDWIASRPSACN